MARDLIPPPSPAGRPQTPDGTPVLVELPPEPAPLSVEPAETSPPPGPSQFRNRFGFLLGALAGVFIAVALVAAILIADRNGGGAAGNEGLAANWSRWQPSDTTLQGGSQQIADHVAAEYKHPDGKQLVAVTAGSLPDDATMQLRTSTVTNIDGPRLLYTMNGFGADRSIKGGTPSTTRLKVIYREALELALYTFRYLPDAESVTVLLPPAPPTAAEQQAAALASATGTTSADQQPLPALFYRPGDLRQQLQMPLGNTLAAKAPSTSSYTGPEADDVETLTTSNRFEVSPTTTGVLLDRP